jgi:tetratricopeptide (TPR) repeat protein
MWRSFSSHRCGLKACAWGFSLALLAACTTVPVAPGAATAPAPNTTDPAQLITAAQGATNAGRFPEAAHLYLQAAQHSEEEQGVEEAARATYDRAQLHVALQIAQRWLEINPTSQQAHEIAALAALKLYRIDVAYEHLDDLLASAYITPASGFLELLPKLDAADSNAALAVMKRLTAHYPTVAEAHYALARLAGETANRELMMSEAQRARELSPYWSPAGLLFALAQLNAGQADAAVQTAQDIVKNDDSIATRTEYASLLLAAGHAQEAVKLLQELEQADGDTSPAVRALAQIDFQVGNYQSAFARFSRLLNTGKNLSESIYYLAGIAERSGAADEARQLYARVQEGEFALAAQVRLARLIQQQDGLNAALVSLQQYGDAKPDELLATVSARAELLAESGDNVGALALYDQSLQNFPDVVSLKLSRAFLLVKMNKIDAALTAMRGLLAERPEDPIVLNALGYTLVDRTRQHKPGRDYIATALKFTPDSGAVLDSMGWALFKLGQKEAALDYLQRAVNRIVDADLDFHLGEVLWALNRRDDAKQAWEVGLTHAPDSIELQKRLKRAEKSSKGSSKAAGSSPAATTTN